MSRDGVWYVGWGSLLWDPRELATQGGWSAGGPVLPIEFSRIALDGRLTLVVDERHGAPVTTGVIRSTLSLDQALENLASREQTDPEWIGYVDLERGRSSGDRHSEQAPVHDRIAEWSAGRGAHGVLWTALPPTFEERSGLPYSIDAALNYLRGLRGETRRRALEYVTRAPPATRTPFRTAFAAWAADGDGSAAMNGTGQAGR